MGPLDGTTQFHQGLNKIAPDMTLHVQAANSERPPQSTTPALWSSQTCNFQSV